MGPSLFFRGMVPIDRFRLERSIWTSLKNWANTAVGGHEARGGRAAEEV
jgi:hypothetical protein